jgi:ectoine utilization protein EutC
MGQIVIFTEIDLRAAISLDADIVDCIENAFEALATLPVIMPPVQRLDIREYNGEVDIKTAYVPGVDSFAVKISPGFFDNPARGLASVNGLMALFSAHTGLAEAVFLDNGFLTDLRTAAAGAVAARHLARTDARRVTILGAGVQARLQLEALTLVRPVDAATIWARDAGKAKATAALLSNDLGLPVTFEPDAQRAVQSADIVVTTTPATQPILLSAWLQPGQHVTAMGSDAGHKNELDPAAILRSDLYVADSRAQVAEMGELHHAIRRGVVPASLPVSQLGEVVAGIAPGRTSADQLTICDLTGTGVQDTAIAALARKRLSGQSIGTCIINRQPGNQPACSP